MTSNHHPKSLSILHALREDARIDVEARAGRVGTCRMESASRQPSVSSPAELIMGGTVLKNRFKNR